MRTRTLAAVLGGALLLAGCGDRNLVLNVDVKSFLAESQSKAAIGPVPPLAGGLFLGEQPMVDDVTINLLQGVSGMVAVHDVSVRIRTAFHDSTGGGSDTLKVYVSDENTDPMSTAPALVQAVTFTPGMSDTVESTLSGDPRIAEIFTKHRMRLSVTTALRGPAAGAPLNGRFEVLKLDAVVVAGRKGM